MSKSKTNKLIWLFRHGADLESVIWQQMEINIVITSFASQNTSFCRYVSVIDNIRHPVWCLGKFRSTFFSKASLKHVRTLTGCRLYNELTKVTTVKYSILDLKDFHKRVYRLLCWFLYFDFVKGQRLAFQVKFLNKLDIENCWIATLL